PPITTRHGDPGNVLAFAENSRAEVRLEGGDGQTTGSLKTGGGKAGQSYPAVVASVIPRRLTPVECERLQSWPDGWTAWGVDESGNRVEMADGPRYRMAGNGVTSSVAEWIGRRIVAADRAAYADAKEVAV